MFASNHNLINFVQVNKISLYSNSNYLSSTVSLLWGSIDKYTNYCYCTVLYCMAAILHLQMLCEFNSGKEYKNLHTI